jgi:predicted metalloendopeptidase
MSQATKTAALEKLARMDVMVGYPDKFRNYDALRIDANDLYGNVVRAGRFNADYQRSQLGKKVDRKLWGMNPQTVNAYNGFTENKIVFPAGILQAPFFDPNADDAVNYGAIGAVIGHEISHGFDDQGRKVDATGAVRDWWTAEDGKRFEEQAKIFGAQYAKFEAAPGAFVNPELTMGENIADLAGALVALDAYHTATSASSWGWRRSGAPRCARPRCATRSPPTRTARPSSARSARSATWMPGIRSGMSSRARSSILHRNNARGFGKAGSAKTQGGSGNAAPDCI